MKKPIWKNDDNDDQSQPQQLPNGTSSPAVLNDLISTAGSVRSLENRIYFYSEVNNVACSELNKLLTEIDSKLTQVKALIDTPNFNPVIHLHINSSGGDVFAGLSTIDTIRRLKSDVYTYVEGGVASAATLISVCGKRRFIGKHSFMLIHQISSLIQGTFEEIECEYENSKRIMSTIKSIYKTYTKIPMKEIDNILKHDIWMDGDVCLKYGLADEII